MTSKLRVLDFDIENRPLSYLGGDFTTSEITAIAWCFVDEPKTMTCVLLGRDDPRVMLERFVAYYNAADMVTGHYIRMHDLPKINGALVERRMNPLKDMLTCDTKLDLVKHGGEISASQENLCAMLGLSKPKVHMNTVMWREANRLTDAGLKLTAKRAIGDVIQHMQLRKALVEGRLLSEPKIWRP